jgi:hypothetical protein
MPSTARGRIICGVILATLFAVMASATLALPATAAVPFYKIEAEHSGKALTISDLSTVNGEQVRQRTFVLGYWNHHWAKLPKDDGTYMFQARFSRQCMGVGGNWWQSGAPVIQQPIANG